MSRSSSSAVQRPVKRDACWVAGIVATSSGGCGAALASGAAGSGAEVDSNRSSAEGGGGEMDILVGDASTGLAEGLLIDIAASGKASGDSTEIGDCSSNGVTVTGLKKTKLFALSRRYWSRELRDPPCGVTAIEFAARLGRTRDKGLSSEVVAETPEVGRLGGREAVARTVTRPRFESRSTNRVIKGD